MAENRYEEQLEQLFANTPKGAGLLIQSPLLLWNAPVECHVK